MNKLYLLIFLTALHVFSVSASEKAGFLLKPAAEKGREMNSILASVNGEAISLHDILPYTRDKEYVAYASCQASSLPNVIADIRKKAVDDLIDRKLIAAEYKNGSFRIPVQDIDAELDRFAVNMGAKSRSDFIAALRKSGVEYSKMRHDVEEYMAVQLMLHRCALGGNQITPEELFNYYNSHKNEFSEPDSVELAMILVKSEDVAVQIAKKLKENPECFASLAAKYSVGPGKTNGGLLGRIETGRLRPEFAAAISDYSDGKVYGPVKTDEGVNFLRIVKFISGSRNDYFTALPQIREKLEKKRREERFAKYKSSLREKAVVRYFFTFEKQGNEK